MSDRTDGIWAVGGSLAGLAIIGALTLWMSTCVQYDRWKERECLYQGGAIINNPGPGAAASGSNRDACMKIEVQMTPIALPRKP